MNVKTKMISIALMGVVIGVSVGYLIRIEFAWQWLTISILLLLNIALLIFNKHTKSGKIKASDISEKDIFGGIAKSANKAAKALKDLQEQIGKQQ